MITKTGSRGTAVERPPAHISNGAALASFLAAGVGAFAMGFFVILGEAGVFSAPAIYAPAGGVSGRTTCATVTWLIAWIVLHRRWRQRELAPRGVYMATLVLIALGVLATFPPVWALFE